MLCVPSVEYITEKKILKIRKQILGRVADILLILPSREKKRDRNIWFNLEYKQISLGEEGKGFLCLLA